MDTQAGDCDKRGCLNSDSISGWTIVDRVECGELDENVLETSARRRSELAYLIEGMFGTPSNGTASPENEKAADIVLSQDISAATAELADPTLPPDMCKDGTQGQHQPGSLTLQEQIQDPVAPTDVSTLGAISQETSALAAVLAVTERQLEQQCGAAMAAVSHWLVTLGEFLGSAAEEIQAEWTELRRLVSLAMEQAKTKVEDTRARVAKVLNNIPSSWTLISLSAVTALAVVAAGALWISNRRLAQQVRVRDKELASLVVRILNLQETLRRPGGVTSGPLMCHTAVVMPPAASLCSYTMNGWA
ncbi:hypothetical protein CEUSTIGMA_g3445.t1 [Chlamydomonas eustigma]|uniref:Uncharacterized protein n=1 Tax=Chlamydomonas eustigma TaxID=1157962 RepID=A0A250WZG0_9CHLO|nr:hypothetical protein CEUSTIGMA_g3445.t1 [Chlamydomonas eustigma]|eukprot:GAX76002.1 hypothetical protein CEUSTIGMA_g3445.t1 [Chlamydomonas eustigma]